MHVCAPCEGTHMCVCVFMSVSKCVHALKKNNINNNNKIKYYKINIQYV